MATLGGRLWLSFSLYPPPPVKSGKIGQVIIDFRVNEAKRRVDRFLMTRKPRLEVPPGPIVTWSTCPRKPQLVQTLDKLFLVYSNENHVFGALLEANSDCHNR